jgi:hypothetical protein
MLSYYKFVSWDAIPIENAMQHNTIKAINEYENDNKKPLKDLHIVLDSPYIDFGGWRFNLRPYLKKYWVKLKYYGIQEYYALNKTDIRKEFNSYVIQIIEINTEV